MYNYLNKNDLIKHILVRVKDKKEIVYETVHLKM